MDRRHGRQAVRHSRTLRVGLTHHQAGRLDRAEALYRKIHLAEPEHADALHLLGVLAFQCGKMTTALQLWLSERCRRLRRCRRFTGTTAMSCAAPVGRRKRSPAIAAPLRWSRTTAWRTTIWRARLSTWAQPRRARKRRASGRTDPGLRRCAREPRRGASGARAVCRGGSGAASRLGDRAG